MKLNFRMSEFLKSDIARQKGISNVPSSAELDCLLDLIVNVMQPIRNYIGKPIIITSGYRNQQVNKLVGGVATSQHTKGQACDFIIQGMPINEIIEKIKGSGVEYDQLINEYGQWVHISYKREGNRKQFIVL